MQTMDARDRLLSRFDAIARDRTNAPAVVADSGASTFGELGERISHHRRIIRTILGSERAIIGHCVANGTDAIALELAAWAEGHVSLALPRGAMAHEVSEFLGAAVPSLVILGEGSNDGSWPEATIDTGAVHWLNTGVTTRPPRPVSHNPPISPDLLQLQFTSGSTGRPKAVGLDADALLTALADAADWYRRFPEGPVFSTLPQHHAMGRAVALETLWAGRTIASSNKKTWGEHLDRVSRFGCATLICNPTYTRMLVTLGLLKHQPTIQRIVLGTANVENDLVSDLRAQMEGVSIDIRYGVSECFGPISVRHIEPAEPVPETGDVGRAMPSVELSPMTGTQGPLRVRGAATATTSIQDRTASPVRDEAGYVETGDIAAIDPKGHLRLAGRTNVSINHRGHRIDPLEIEAVIKGTPAIVDALVIGVSDRIVGERIVAAVVAQTNAVDAEAVKHRCRTKLSPYKVPHAVVELPAIPCKASGKPDREATLSKVIEKL